MSIFHLFAVALVLSGPTAMAWNWGDKDSANNPVIFENDYEYHYSQLPLKGSVGVPWSETYWPSKRGSINYRWNTTKNRGFKYDSPSKERAQEMSMDELKQLSPSEKFDLAMGHYDYPLRQSVDQEIADKRARSWEGLCNGWAPASLFYAEPKPVNFTNPDGIVVPFGSSDLKGLLSYFIAVAGAEQVEVSQIGLRCENNPPLGVGPDECDDVNAGALHVVLTNEIGKRGKGFVADITRTKEVWNQPVYGYEMTEVGSAKTRYADHAIRIKAKILYGEELGHSHWHATLGQKENRVGVQQIDYILELDSENRITGGEWISKLQHPDFIWRVDNMKDLRFKGVLEGLDRIYRPEGTQ